MKFSILDWNIQGTKYFTQTKFKKVRPILNKSKADIFCIQEGQDLFTEIRNMSKFKEFHLVFSKENKDGSNVILSRFPITNYGEFNPNLFTNITLGKILWANIQIKEKNIRIYNCHFEIDGIGPKERIELLKFIITNSKDHKGGVIICGDLNTTIPANGVGRKIVQLIHGEPFKSLFIKKRYMNKDERYSFLEEAKHGGFEDALNIERSTWRVDKINWQIFNLKLDWFLFRGLKIKKIRVGRFISDHRSIFVKCST